MPCVPSATWCFLNVEKESDDAGNNVGRVTAAGRGTMTRARIGVMMHVLNTVDTQDLSTIGTGRWARRNPRENGVSC